MDLANLRKLRLLFEDFPKNHNLVLIGRIVAVRGIDERGPIYNNNAHNAVFPDLAT